MQQFLENINNREILTEVLHHAIDYLIGNRDDQHTIRMCHKYGFQNPDDFLLATKTISKYYRRCCYDNGETDFFTKFPSLSPELSRVVLAVLAARRPEVMAYLAKREYSKNHPFVESFCWDTRLVMGDSSFGRNFRNLFTLTLQCRQLNSKFNVIFCEMNKAKLCELIDILEQADKTMSK